MDLQSFLINNTIDDMTFETPVSTRLKDKDGKLYQFKFGTLKDEVYEKIRNDSTKVDINTKNIKIDATTMFDKIIIETSIVPDFKNAESLKAAGCTLPIDFLKKTMLLGERQTYAQIIQEKNGFKVNINDLKDEAKN